MNVDIPKLELIPWHNTSLVAIQSWNLYSVALLQAFQKVAETLKYSTIEEQNNLQQLYNATLEEKQKEWKELNKQGDKQNIATFLADPKKVYEEIMANKGSLSSMGETLMMFCIGKVTMKREGKGTLIGKGTLGQCTMSNIKATATIGKYTWSEDVCCSSNTSRQDEMKANMLNTLAVKIIEGEVLQINFPMV